jgi:uncharacterized membrane-anchored protein YjiN (DUF445 family)
MHKTCCLSLQKKVAPAARERSQQQELENAMHMAQLYERQVNDLLHNLKEADHNWERAETVRAHLCTPRACVAWCCA